MRTRRKLRSSAYAAFVVALCTSAALAWETRGSISGTVTDSTCAVVAGDAIKLVNTGTDMLFTAETTSAGLYRRLFFNPGGYRLSAAESGFKTFDGDNIVLHVAQSAGIGTALQVGAQSESVTIISERALLEVEKIDRRGHRNAHI